jgi:hypothetical protein
MRCRFRPMVRGDASVRTVQWQRPGRRAASQRTGASKQPPDRTSVSGVACETTVWLHIKVSDRAKGVVIGIQAAGVGQGNDAGDDTCIRFLRALLISRKRKFFLKCRSASSWQYEAGARGWSSRKLTSNGRLSNQSV